MELKQINKIKVNAIPIKRVNPENVKGKSIFEELYANVFICAKKKSGKTSVINKILDECMGRDTKLIIFCSTVNKDVSYRHIVKKWTKKGNDVITYTSIIEDKVNQLKELIEQVNINEESDSDYSVSSSSDEFKFIKTGIEEDKVKKVKKLNYVAPDIIFIFDDLSTELRNKEIASLVKKNRHIKSKVIISSQWAHDLEPSSLKQIDYVILFGGHSIAKLNKFHTDIDLTMPFEDFIELYKDATANKYGFLFIDCINGKFRKNLNMEYKFKL
jgi:hypothetical protein